MNYTTLHIIFAWLSTLAIILLALLYPLNYYTNTHEPNSQHPLYKARSILKKTHKPLGIIVIITILIHGRFSMQHPGFNLGTLCLLLTLLLACSYMLKKVLRQYWKHIHKALTISLIIATILHIIFKIN